MSRWVFCIVSHGGFNCLPKEIIKSQEMLPSMAIDSDNDQQWLQSLLVNEKCVCSINTNDVRRRAREKSTRTRIHGCFSFSYSFIWMMIHRYNVGAAGWIFLLARSLCVCMSMNAEKLLFLSLLSMFQCLVYCWNKFYSERARTERYNSPLKCWW